MSDGQSLKDGACLLLPDQTLGSEAGARLEGSEHKGPMFLGPVHPVRLLTRCPVPLATASPAPSLPPRGLEMAVTMATLLIQPGIMKPMCFSFP